MKSSDFEYKIQNYVFKKVKIFENTNIKKYFFEKEF
jgi:hypothetical protein